MVIGRGGFGARLNFWKATNEGADIAVFMTTRFLKINGRSGTEYPEFKAGGISSGSMINGSASSQFLCWLWWERPLLVPLNGGGGGLFLGGGGFLVNPPFYFFSRETKPLRNPAGNLDFIVTVPPTGESGNPRHGPPDGSGTTQRSLEVQWPSLATAYYHVPIRSDWWLKWPKMGLCEWGPPAMNLNPSKEKPRNWWKNWGMKMDGKMEWKWIIRAWWTIPKWKWKTRDQVIMKMSDKAVAWWVWINPIWNLMTPWKSLWEDQKIGNEGFNAQMPGMNDVSEYNYDYLKSTEKN